jgi:hypothetical protein
MAVISHKNITDPQIHEPKGISAANAGEVYVADGSGSGSWVGQGEIDGHTALVDDVEGQGPITGGAAITPKSLGTISTGTVTPNPSARGIQYYTNAGAHTLAVPSTEGSLILEITNSSGAGAISTSGYTRVTGDAFTTTSGHKFLCFVCRRGTNYWLNVMAGQ